MTQLAPPLPEASDPDALASPLAVVSAHVTVCTARRERRLEDADIARRVFNLLRDNPRTLAAVVMPDHVHWLMRDGSALAEAVRGFKRASENLVAATRSRLSWQRSFFDTPVESDAMVRLSARFLLANPVAAGLAGRWQDYPWAYLCPRLRGEPGRYMLRR